VTSFLIAEAQPTSPIIGEYGVEQFLSDGIFELGIIEDHEPMRYIQVKKIRGVMHDMNKYAFKIDDGMRVWGKLIDSQRK
jgi:KaiC/GvpD/RAD55 family RecA-like ATPase